MVRRDRRPAASCSRFRPPAARVSSRRPPSGETPGARGSSSPIVRAPPGTYSRAAALHDRGKIPPPARAPSSRAARYPMSLVVQKFGGTSVADVDRIRHVAGVVAATRAAGHELVVVVSAMAGETNRLLALARQAARTPDDRESDVLVATGEQVTAALLALTLQDTGVDARSFLGHQIRIETDSAFSRARIVRVDVDRLRRAPGAGPVAARAGFQGVDGEGSITTLGRGGSDTSAVALAAALGADTCEIYTDVDRVHTADPRIVPNARKLHAVSYGEMLEMAASGARVLQLRSVEFARNHDVKLHVRSSFSAADGTWIREEDERMLEKALISGVTHKSAETVYRVEGVSAAQLFEALAQAGVNVDTVIQTGLEIVFSADEGPGAEDALGSLGVEWSAREDLGQVSVIGAGMKSHPGVAAKMFSALEELGIQPVIVSTSPIKIGCFVARDQVEQ